MCGRMPKDFFACKDLVNLTLVVANFNSIPSGWSKSNNLRVHDLSRGRFKSQSSPSTSATMDWLCNNCETERAMLAGVVSQALASTMRSWGRQIWISFLGFARNISCCSAYNLSKMDWRWWTKSGSLEVRESNWRGEVAKLRVYVLFLKIKCKWEARRIIGCRGCWLIVEASRLTNLRFLRALLYPVKSGSDGIVYKFCDGNRWDSLHISRVWFKTNSWMHWLHERFTLNWYRTMHKLSNYLWEKHPRRSCGLLWPSTA